MAAIDDANVKFMADAAIVSQVVHGDENTVVQTDNGPVRSLAKLLKDSEVNIANKVDADQVGVAGGVAALDQNGFVPASQLPSYVDDVIDVATFAALPVAGESGKIYVVVADETHNGKTTQYRWSGSAYAIILAAPDSSDNVTEGQNNLYFTEARARAAKAVGVVFDNASDITAADSLVVALGKLQAQMKRQPYDFSGFVPGKPSAAALVMFAKAARPFVIPAGLSGSKVKAKTAATANCVFTLYKGATAIGTLTFAAGGTVPTLAAAATTSFAIDEELTIIAPATADATLADIAMTIAANLNIQ